MINVKFCRNGRVADVTGSYAACEKGRLAHYDRMEWGSRRTGSSGDNNSRGGR